MEEEFGDEVHRGVVAEWGGRNQENDTGFVSPDLYFAGKMWPCDAGAAGQSQIPHLCKPQRIYCGLSVGAWLWTGAWPAGTYLPH